MTESGQPGQGPAKVVDGQVQIDAVLGSDPNSDEAFATVRGLRVDLDDVSGADALVGGTTAINLDVARVRSGTTRSSFRSSCW